MTLRKLTAHLWCTYGKWKVFSGWPSFGNTRPIIRAMPPAPFSSMLKWKNRRASICSFTSSSATLHLSALGERGRSFYLNPNTCKAWKLFEQFWKPEGLFWKPTLGVSAMVCFKFSRTHLFVFILWWFWKLLGPFWRPEGLFSRPILGVVRYGLFQGEDTPFYHLFGSILGWFWKLLEGPWGGAPQEPFP